MIDFFPTTPNIPNLYQSGGLLYLFLCDPQQRRDAPVAGKPVNGRRVFGRGAFGSGEVGEWAGWWDGCLAGVDQRGFCLGALATPPLFPFSFRGRDQAFCAAFLAIGTEIPAKLTVVTYFACVSTGMCMYVCG